MLNTILIFLGWFMKQRSIVIGCYALLIFIGGIIGYFVANSLISLIVSSMFALSLMICTALVWKGSLTAYHIATTLTFLLFAFFSYRFFLTYKLAPAGIMAVLSGCLFAYLFATRQRAAHLFALSKVKVKR